MLQLSDTVLNQPVLSLRTGTVIATVSSAIINPDNLKIEGFYCEDRYDKQTLVLLYQDIREILDKGYVVNDHDVLTHPDELVRLKKIIELGFNPVGKQVQTISKQKLGKVSDYAVDSSTMYIHKLYVSQSIVKSFTGGNLSIDRTQINEITPNKIIINDLANKGKGVASAAVTA